MGIAAGGFVTRWYVRRGCW